MPLKTAEYLVVTWDQGQGHVCRLSAFVELLSAAASVLNLLAVSVERYHYYYYYYYCTTYLVTSLLVYCRLDIRKGGCFVFDCVLIFDSFFPLSLFPLTATFNEQILRHRLPDPGAQLVHRRQVSSLSGTGLGAGSAHSGAAGLQQGTVTLFCSILLFFLFSFCTQTTSLLHFFLFLLPTIALLFILVH